MLISIKNIKLFDNLIRYSGFWPHVRTVFQDQQYMRRAVCMWLDIVTRKIIYTSTSVSAGNDTSELVMIIYMYKIEKYPVISKLQQNIFQFKKRHTQHKS